MSKPIELLQHGMWSGVIEDSGTVRRFMVNVRLYGPHKGTLSARYFVEARTLVLAYEGRVDQIVTGVRSLSFDGANHLETT